MNQATIQPSLKPILRDLEYTPPACETGSYPGWQFVFSLAENSGISVAGLKARASEIASLDEIKVQGDKITVKFLGTRYLDKPREVDEFHRWLLRLTTERQWEPRNS